MLSDKLLFLCEGFVKFYQADILFPMAFCSPSSLINFQPGRVSFAIRFLLKRDFSSSLDRFVIVLVAGSDNIFDPCVIGWQPIFEWLLGSKYLLLEFFSLSVPFPSICLSIFLYLFLLRLPGNTTFLLQTMATGIFRNVNDFFHIHCYKLTKISSQLIFSLFLPPLSLSLSVNRYFSLLYAFHHCSSLPPLSLSLSPSLPFSLSLFLSFSLFLSLSLSLSLSLPLSLCAPHLSCCIAQVGPRFFHRFQSRHVAWSFFSFCLKLLFLSSLFSFFSL